MITSAHEAPRSSQRKTWALVSAAVAACALCCAGPVVGILAALGLTAALLAIAIPALAWSRPRR